MWDANFQDELYHHGIKGQRWGIRRYQNEDGSLTNSGKKRYGADLDINDKTRTNIAKIRLGEARRRLDTAKNNNDTNYTRIADLKARERSAKNAVMRSKKIDRGAKRAAKGETISGNNLKRALVVGTAYAAADLLPKYLNSRLADLYANGRYTPQHRAAADFINKAGTIGIYGLAYAYSTKKAIDNSNLRAYQSSKYMSDATIKSIGSSEYKDVVNRRKGGN